MRYGGRAPLAVCLALMCVFSCAKQGFPPGGPEDDVPPAFEMTIPEVGATNVSRREPLIFAFTEQMDEQSVEENFFIVPIPAEWPSFFWWDRGRTLVVELAEDLEPDATYVVSIGAKSRDRNRNALEETLMLTFSTGDVLEEKRIIGRVLDEGFLGPDPSPAAQIDVVAYRAEPGGVPDPRDDVPDYVTQTGADGTYELIGLSSGEYHLFAIGDNDQDGFFTENYDRIGIAPHVVRLAESDSVVTAPVLVVAARRSDDIQLTSARAPDSRRVELFFDREIVIGSLSVTIPGLDVTHMYSDGESPRKITLATTAQQAGYRYEITGIDAADRDDNHIASLEFIPFFDGVDQADTTALAITLQEPSLVTRPDEPVVLTFNRVLDLPDGMSGIMADDGRLSLGIEHPTPNMIVLTPVEQWQLGTEYRILLDPERIRGVAGNRLTDDTAEIVIRTAPSDTLSALSGTLADNKGEGPYRILICQADSASIREISLEVPGNWESGPLLPGSYLLYGHRDSNGDGIIDLGSVAPFTPSEQVTAHPDTLVLESRWPKEGFELRFE